MLASRDRRGLKGPQGLRDRRVRPGLRERLEGRELTAHPVPTASQGPTEPPVRLAVTVLPALWGLQGLKDRPALTVHPVRLALTVPRGRTVAAS